jgi:hypothetical protein
MKGLEMNPDRELLEAGVAKYNDQANALRKTRDLLFALHAIADDPQEKRALTQAFNTIENVQAGVYFRLRDAEADLRKIGVAS